MSQGTPRSLCSRTMQLHKCEYKYQLIAFLKMSAWLGNSSVSLWDEDGGCWPPSWILRHGAREDMSACDQTGQCCHEYWFKNVLFYSESKLSICPPPLIGCWYLGSQRKLCWQTLMLPTLSLHVLLLGEALKIF